MNMNTKRLFILSFSLFFSLGVFCQKWEKVGDRPQMGWNSWNKFGGNINENLIKGIADAIVETGLREAGYVYVNLDDCWHGKRDADGFIHPDPDRFPGGMKALADYVHAKGLKLGIYSDCGTATCAGRPGSLGHEYQDALQYARWGIDYLKEDWCNTTDVNARGAYKLMSDALRAAGRPIFLSMCEWGNNKPWLWAKDVGHSWRIGPDIWCNFDSTRVHPQGFTDVGVMQCIRLNEPLRAYAGPGHWNDPDMLEVGNGMTVNEDRAHFAMWCMMASPLILGNDLRNMSAETKAIITNAEMIAVDQDELGVQGLRFATEQGLEFWFKPLKDGDWAMTILNPTKEAVSYALNWQHFNFIDSEVSRLGTYFDTKVYRIRNLWTHKDEGMTLLIDKVWRTLSVPARDVISYRLTPVSVKSPTTAQQLVSRLKRLTQKGIMFGHQDAPFYGLGWKYEEGRCDVRDVAGDYPAVMGFELGGIEVGDEKNLDSVPFHVMRREILKQHARGGVVTISWHPRNPLTGSTAWDNSDKTVVRNILPGGKRHGVFQIWLRRLTTFLASLQDEQGRHIPFIFRPWHENSGGWFWWGRGLCSAEEYKALWNLTQDYVSHSLPYNIVWSWSPNYGFAPDVLDTYPGHDRVDIIGLDAYQQRNGEQAFVDQLKKDLTTLSQLAREGKRMMALTECGYQNVPDPTWWSRVLLPNLKPWPLSYFLVWRNADRRQYFAPAPGTPDADSFRKMVNDKKVLMLKDINK
ncbi:MAG: alpha-galactosidase [Bacteroidaceae bacterium]|nr:alpha-galactosidase [Bacteroidaceae bacterium]